MKKIALGTIVFYQAVIFPLLKQILGVSAICRYSPSCSEYAKIVIGRYGALRGGVLALRRLLSCQPYYNSKRKSQTSKLQLKSKKCYSFTFLF